MLQNIYGDEMDAEDPRVRLAQCLMEDEAQVILEDNSGDAAELEARLRIGARMQDPETIQALERIVRDTVSEVLASEYNPSFNLNARGAEIRRQNRAAAPQKAAQLIMDYLKRE